MGCCEGVNAGSFVNNATRLSLVTGVRSAINEQDMALNDVCLLTDLWVNRNTL